MKLSWNMYAVLAVIFLGSAFATWLFRSSELVRAITAIPIIFTLFGALYQLLRDEAAHLKALAVQHDQQRFALGITSHMADVAFDRHVALCDEFMQGVFATLQCLMLNVQDHEAAKKKADAIGDVIRKHVVWITPELEEKLEKFQAKVREIAGQAFMEDRHPRVDSRQQPARELLLDMIDTGSAPGTPPKKKVLFLELIDEAREVLGVKELTDLRGRILRTEGID